MKAIQAEPEVSSVNEQGFTSERPLLSIALWSTFFGIIFVVGLAQCGTHLLQSFLISEKGSNITKNISLGFSVKRNQSLNQF